MATLSILVVEDDPDFYTLIADALAAVSKWTVTLTRAKRLEEALRADDDGNVVGVIADPAAVLLDLTLPDSDPPETLAALTHFDPVPVIVLTSLDDETMAANALRHGAQDYLVKDELRPQLLHKTIQYAIERKNLELELRQSQAALQASNKQLIGFADMAREALEQPLQDIRQSCQLLLRMNQEGSDKSTLDQLRLSIQMSQHSAEMLGDLSGYARALADHQMPTPQDLRAIIDTVKRRLESGHYSEITLGVEVDDAIPPLIARRFELERLFTSLFRIFSVNKSRSGPDGEAINLSLQRQTNNHYLLCIAGTQLGGPLPQERQLLDIFRRMFAYNTSLALLISQRIIADYGGECWVEADANQKLKVYLKWPKQPQTQRPPPTGAARQPAVSDSTAA